MAIEKADDNDVTYVGADKADHPLITGKWYIGYYLGHGKVFALPNTPGIVAYWDGDQFLNEPNGKECEMHTYDYLVEAEVNPAKPPKTPAQRFVDYLRAVRVLVDNEVNEFPGLKTRDACARKGFETFADKKYAFAYVWYSMAACRSMGNDLFKHYDESADNARTLAFADFVKEKQS